MPRWNQLPNDPDQDEEDEDDDDDDFEVRNSVFMRTKTKKFVKKEKTNSGGSLTESSDWNLSIWSQNLKKNEQINLWNFVKLFLKVFLNNFRVSKVSNTKRNFAFSTVLRKVILQI